MPLFARPIVGCVRRGLSLGNLRYSWPRCEGLRADRSRQVVQQPYGVSSCHRLYTSVPIRTPIRVVSDDCGWFPPGLTIRLREPSKYRNQRSLPRPSPSYAVMAAPTGRPVGGGECHLGRRAHPRRTPQARHQRVSKRTIQRYLPRTGRPPASPSTQTWGPCMGPFLKNHAPQIWARDFTGLQPLLPGSLRLRHHRAVFAPERCHRAQVVLSRAMCPANRCTLAFWFCGRPSY